MYLNNTLRRLVPHALYNFKSVTQASNAVTAICDRLLAQR
jgi:hypothetical protein